MSATPVVAIALNLVSLLLLISIGWTLLKARREDDE